MQNLLSSFTSSKFFTKSKSPKILFFCHKVRIKWRKKSLKEKNLNDIILIDLRKSQRHRFCSFWKVKLWPRDAKILRNSEKFIQNFEPHELESIAHASTVISEKGQV